MPKIRKSAYADTTFIKDISFKGRSQEQYVGKRLHLLLWYDLQRAI